MSHRISPRPGLPAWGALGAWALLLALACSTTARAQISPAESAKKLKPADGLEATLWASEPMLVNPTNMDIDSRGRVWVTEGLNYRLTRAGKKFSRIEESDKIKILEDTDGDGKADKVTVFADRIFPVPMGLAVEEHYGKDGKYQGCKVFVGNSPDLLVLEDTDGDDKADKRYALLTGFGGIDSDHGVHGMVLGLDGKLYFTHGDGCCTVENGTDVGARNFNVVDKSGRHVWSDQLANTLRVNRDGTEFEVLADRQRNNYETSLNAFGNVFTSDNDDDGNRGCRVIQILDGGHYGYRTSPRLHWGEEIPGNVPKLVGTGNGSPCGIMVYEGGLLSGEYSGAVLEADAGTRQINLFPLQRQGAAFRTEYKVFLGSDDPWFRPVDMTAAPDGSVFVADWYDAGVGGHSFRDQDTGRIYRVAPKGSKAKAEKADFATVHGLIAALKSPVVATQDAARRGLIERGRDQKQKVADELVRLYSEGKPVERARALWALSAVVGDSAAENALKDSDPRIREQAVRILGRDDRENGKVEYKEAAAQVPPLALKNLKTLTPMAADPDAGVRRELILALRTLPTDRVGEALKTLARTWDGRDRWYLEALGLALEKRESEYVASLFDGTLYGDLDLSGNGGGGGGAGRVAVPPYFPADRNEAFIETGAPEPAASALSKTLGLAWRLHRPEVLPLLGRALPTLDSPELQQAADDVLAQMKDPETAVVLAGLALKSDDPARTRQILATLGRKLDGDWQGAKGRGEVVEATEKALKDPELKLQGVELAAASKDARYAGPLEAFAHDEKEPVEVRAAAVEALAQIKPPHIRGFLDSLIAASKANAKGTAIDLAEAAVRALPRVEDARDRLGKLIVEKEYPLAIRREALRTFARLGDGGTRVLEMARSGKLPDDLKTEATSVVHAHPDRRVRDQAARVLPLPKSAAGRPLPPIADLLRRDGKADHGRDVFFRAGTGANRCGSCHRVQGRGQWVGPDLSTIGTKYGKDELLRSILNPSAAIGYNFRALTVALGDGRVLTGLALEDGPDRLILKTAEGQRITVRPADVEERKTSEVSLMPEGLAQTMTDADLVDLLAFLSSLRQPVSIVGQLQVIGPVAEPKDALAIDPTEKIDLTANLRGPEGQKLSWRRLDANAEGVADLTTLAGADASKAVWTYVPVVSPIGQEALLVIDSKADLKVWLGGKPVALPGASEDGPRALTVDLPKGTSDLLIRVPGGPAAALVTTFVAARPLEFRAGESKASAR